MKSHKEIYNQIRSLVSKVQHLSPRLSNLGLMYSFDTKIRCLEIMQKYTLERIRKLFKAYEGEKESSVYLEDTTRLLHEGIAFVEAYLNAFYSFLQIIGKLTPYFYDKKNLEELIPDNSFAKQISHFVGNPDVDPEYSSYLKNNMGWHDELMSNRHAITHNTSAFLGFGEKEIVLIHMPKRRIDFFEHGKPTKKLEEYILNNWNSLFKFLNFYVEHFSSREIFVDKEAELKELRKIHRKKTSKQFRLKCKCRKVIDQPQSKNHQLNCFSIVHCCYTYIQDIYFTIFIQVGNALYFADHNKGLSDLFSKRIKQMRR